MCERGPLTCGNVVGGPLSYTWWGYRKRPRFGGHQVLGSQACELHKRADRLGRVRGLWGMRGEVWVRTILLAGLVRALTCGYGGGGGMQSPWKPTPSRLTTVA